MVSWILVFGGCLERVTGEAVPLDPRFYAGRENDDGRGVPDGAGTPGDGQGGEAGQGTPSGDGEAPWSGFTGETWTLTGEAVAEPDIEVQIDVNQADPSAPGGQTRVGAIRLVGAAPFEVAVPTSVSEVRLQAFQDLDADGPDEEDPFAEATVTYKGAPPDKVVLKLEKGARGRPGAPGGGASPSGAPAPPPDGLNLPDGPRVKLSGTVASSRDLPVVLDFFHANGEGAGGRSYLGKRVVALGEWSQELPAGFGAVEVEAYQDLTGDSRTGDDPSARVQRPIVIGDSDVGGVSLTIP